MNPNPPLYRSNSKADKRYASRKLIHGKTFYDVHFFLSDTLRITEKNGVHFLHKIKRKETFDSKQVYPRCKGVSSHYNFWKVL